MELLQNVIPPSSTTKPYGGNVKKRVYSHVVFNVDEWVPEDLNDAKHIKDGVPTDYSNGVFIDFHLENTRSQYNDAYFETITLDIDDNDGETITGGKFRTGTGISLEDGTKFTDDYGNEFTVTLYEDLLTIKIDSSSSTWKPVDLSSIGNIYYIPDNPFSDADFNINYDIHVENEVEGKGDFSSSIPVVVDAVADLPEYVDGADLNVNIGPAEGGELTPSDTEYLNGIASQTISGGMDESGASTAANLGNFQFNDYDGSEEHFVLIRCDESAPVQVDFGALGTPEYQAFTASTSTIWLDGDNKPVDAGTEGATAYYKILINETLLAENKGNINLNLPILVTGGTTNGDYELDFRVGAAETVTEEDFWENDELDFDNNFAVTDVQAVQVKVQSIESKVTISTGWAYESGAEAGNAGENQNANPGVTDGQQSFLSLGSAAFIDLKLELGPNEELGQYITLAFAPNIRGTIYLEDGTPRSSGMGGGDKAFATILRDDFTGDHLRLYFVPESDNDDVSDVSISYTRTPYASIFCFINRSDIANTSSLLATFSFSALLKSITKYLGTLFFRITAVPCSSTTLISVPSTLSFPIESSFHLIITFHFIFYHLKKWQ